MRPYKSDKMSDVPFRRDFTSRYVRATNTAETSAMYGANPTDALRDRVAVERRGSRSGVASVRTDTDTLASWLWNFGGTEARLLSLINRGKYAEARELYEEIEETIDSNYDGIMAIRAAISSSDPTESKLGSIADAVINARYLDNKVRFGDSEMSVGDIVRSGGAVAVDAARDEFESLGLSGTAADMLFNGTDQQRAVMRSLVKPLLSDEKISNRAQRIDLAEDVVNNWDSLESTFGDGLAYVVDRLQSSHSSSGGASDTLRSLSLYADTVSSSRGLSGKDLAKHVMSSYGDLLATVFAEDTDPTSPEGNPRKTGITPDQIMAFDSALSAGIKAMAARGEATDISSPAFSKALVDAMDMQAYASSFGVNLIGIGHDTGRSFSKEIGEYISGSVLNPDAPDMTNVMTSLKALRDSLDSRIIGGNDFASDAYRMTGNPVDYLSNVNKTNKGYSSSPVADGMAAALKGYIFKSIVPGIIGGKTADEAFRSAMSGSSYAGTDFIVGLSNTISGYLSGPGREEAADMLAANLIRSFSSGARFSIQDSAFDAAYPRGVPSSAMTDGVKCLRNWYYGNVATASANAQMTTSLMNHFVNDEGLNERDARLLLSVVNSEAANAERLGDDPMAVYGSRLAVGTVYWPTNDHDANGNPVADENGMVRMSQRIADRRQYGWRPDADNSAYDARQVMYRRMYASTEAPLARAMATKTGSSIASDDA